MENPLLAHENVAFLKTAHCREIRLQLEHLHPDVVMEENHIRSTVVLFGSARIPAPDEPTGTCVDKLSPFYDEARKLAKLISEDCQKSGEKEFVVITGGGGGIMEAGNRGANEAGCKSVALNISLPFEQHPNPYVTKDLCFNFHYFHMRKMHFMQRSKAYCAFPGGFGTFDELFEALTLIQTKKIEPRPVILFGKEHWKRMVDWEYFAESGLISPEDLNYITFCDTAAEAWNAITSFYEAFE
jgi:uncharacterized protein (TIGR00730 family)